jgi:hypothetical protein
LGSFVLPNKPIDANVPVTKFAMPLEEVERFAGFKLFPKLDMRAARPTPMCSDLECKLPPPHFWEKDKDKEKEKDGQQQQLQLQQLNGGAHEINSLTTIPNVTKSK